MGKENITKGAKQKLNKLIINIHTGIGECIPKKATEVTENKKELVNMWNIKNTEEKIAIIITKILPGHLSFNQIP